MPRETMQEERWRTQAQAARNGCLRLIRFAGFPLVRESCRGFDQVRYLTKRWGVSVATLLACAGALAQAPDVLSARYLAGSWVSSDYRCTSNHTEYVQIQVKQSLIDATKTDSGGDRCVPTGSRTFSGRLPEQLTIGASYAVVFVTGVPSNPACCRADGYMVLDSTDHFRLCDYQGCKGDQWPLRFRRNDPIPRY